MTTALALKAEADDIYDSAAEQELLARILGVYYAAVLAAVHEVVKATFVDVPGFDPDQFLLEDSATVRMLSQAGARIVRIDETTRQAIAAQLQTGAQRGYNTWQIAHGVPSEGYRGINGLFRETWAGRAETVARTELQTAQRLAAIDRYNATGLVDEVELIDGHDWDAVCRNRDGNVVPIAQAPTLAHPNCTLVLVPIVRATQAPAEPEPVKWGEWHTLEQAQQAASERYPTVQFDFTDAVLETIDPTLRQFDKLAKQYPQVVDRLEYLGTYGGPTAPGFVGGEEGWGRNTWAHASNNGKIIGLNPAFYGDAAKFRESLTRSEASGWHPTGMSSFESVLTHEFGHQVENWLRSVSGNISAFEVVDVSGNGLVSTVFDRWYNEHQPTRRLSDYAVHNAQEGWAEAFAANYHAPANVQRLTYVKKQRELLKALDPKNWRHEAGLADTVTRLEDAVGKIQPGTPAHQITQEALDAARRRLAQAPAGEWRLTRDLPPDERQSARAALDKWWRAFW